MNPSEVFNAIGIDSADASTWLSPVRWGSFSNQAMLKPMVETMETEMLSMYAKDERLVFGENDRVKALNASALAMAHAQRGWRDFYERRAELLGEVIYPPLHEKEMQ
jgi:hypothetical protein